MLKSHLLLFTLAVAVAAPLATPVPKTRTDAVTETVHGVTIHDPYRWLEDQQSPDTRAWIDAQNAYTRSVLDPLPGRAAITKRLEELLKTERFNTPGSVAATNWSHRLAQTVKQLDADPDLKVVSERSPYMRSER
jgi:protease II